ncbi:hypothetical protein GCM10009821_19570 [Aeromicrobium halocynthiae]|uniref:Ribosomal RNA adenine methylase transferase N-terminal domain-containing protein n=1 Tax=Aeromicrobium halocynthiae TaxID=560557 RepID=A0ABN2W2Q1_9ACTN
MPHTTGRHELGQNFLVDPRVVDTVLSVVATWPDDRPLLELGPGDGALTGPLAALGRPVTAVEIDARRAARLRRRLAGRVDVVRGDLARHRLDTGADIVSNVPYGITTPLLRRLLGAPHWHHAILLLQWEVARKRAGVGGTTLMAAQWWPWFTFGLVHRVPATSFRPVTSVDGGLLEVRRRPVPLVADAVHHRSVVTETFTGRGRGVLDVVGRRHGRSVRDLWARSSSVGSRDLPRDLDVEQWVTLAELVPRRSESQQRRGRGRDDDHRQERHP